MYNLMIPFIGGFFITVSLFFLCLFSVLGGKIVIMFLSEIIKKKPNILINQEKPVKKRHYTKRRTTNNSPSSVKPYEKVRSIEINPDEIDKIYVKKSS